ncbi:MAG: hypothetical protein ACTSU2_12930 [Promethearchaeota archaeon]
MELPKNGEGNNNEEENAKALLSEFPNVKGKKFYGALSSIFSFFSLLLSLLGIKYINNLNWVHPFYTTHASILEYLNLMFSALSFSFFIFNIDIPKKFADKLIKINSLEKVGAEKLKKSRIRIPITYVSFYIATNILVSKFGRLNLWDFLLLGLFSILGTWNYPKFFNDINGTDESGIIRSVSDSYIMGMIYAMVLGLGGEFYLSIWIMFMNLVAKLKNRRFQKMYKKTSYKNKLDAKQYWDKIIDLRIHEWDRKVLSTILLLDLFIFFIMFKDFKGLIESIIDKPSNIYLPVVFALNIIISYLFSSIIYEYIRNVNYFKILTLNIMIKFFLVYLIYLTLPYGIDTLRFSSFSTGSIRMDINILFIGVASLDPLISMVLFISRIGDNAINEKNLRKFHIAYFFNELAIILIILLLAFVFSVSITLNSAYLFLFVSSILLLLFGVIIIQEYPNYIKEILGEADGKVIRIPRIWFLFGLSAVSILINILELEFFPIFVFLVKYLLYYFYLAIMIIPFLILYPVSIKLAKTRLEGTAFMITTILYTTAFWAFLLIYSNDNAGLFLVSFYSFFMITGILILLAWLIFLKNKR